MLVSPTTHLIPCFPACVCVCSQDLGVKAVQEAHDLMEKGVLRFEVRSASSIREGGIKGEFVVMCMRWSVCAGVDRVFVV